MENDNAWLIRYYMALCTSRIPNPCLSFFYKVDTGESPLFQNENKALACIREHPENGINLWRSKYCLICTISDIRNSDSHRMGVVSIKLNPLCEQHVFSGLTIYEVNANLSMQLSFFIFNNQKESITKWREKKLLLSWVCTENSGCVFFWDVEWY